MKKIALKRPKNMCGFLYFKIKPVLSVHRQKVLNFSVSLVHEKKILKVQFLSWKHLLILTIVLEATS